MTVETEPWDPSERLGTLEAQQVCLEDAREDGDPALIVAVIGDIARTRSMSEVAKSAGSDREAMYKSFRLGGNPNVRTLSPVVDAPGHSQIRPKPVKRAGSSKADLKRFPCSVRDRRAEKGTLPDSAALESRRTAWQEGPK